jgi:hypothetical protein
LLPAACASDSGNAVIINGSATQPIFINAEIFMPMAFRYPHGARRHDRDLATQKNAVILIGEFRKTVEICAAAFAARSHRD